MLVTGKMVQIHHGAATVSGERLCIMPLFLEAISR
jgi:hypothetical protein